MTAYTLSATATESATMPVRPAAASRSMRTTICGLPEYRASAVGGNISHQNGSRSQRTIATALSAVTTSQMRVNWSSENNELGASRTVVAGEPA